MLNISKRQRRMIEWRDLHAATLGFETPFFLKLANEQMFIGEKILRLLPKKRMVVQGSWEGQSVVAKIFFDPNLARRHMERDAQGIHRLTNYKVPTPQLLHQGVSEDRRVYILVLERIFDSKNLDELFHEANHIQAILPQLKSVMIELATQHVLGVLQHDLHLKNFLISEKNIYTLDGAQVEIFPHLLTKKVSVYNLALFLSQFGVGLEKYQEQLFRHYAKARGWLLKPEDIQELFLLTKHWNDVRWKRYERKIFRNCTDFQEINNFRYKGMVERNYLGPEFQHFLQNPNAIFSKDNVTFLKKGRSSTVIKVTFDNNHFVIKRHNIKTIWHHLRRCLRYTRARTVWRLSQKMKLFHVRTARPIAFIERRFFGLTGTSYYVSEYIANHNTQQNALEYLSQHQHDFKKVSEMIVAIIVLLQNLNKLEMTHGDLKITNILINSLEQPVLIDLDGAREHLNASSLESHWRKEIKRFMKNFVDDKDLHDQFVTAFHG